MALSARVGPSALKVQNFQFLHKVNVFFQLLFLVHRLNVLCLFGYRRFDFRTCVLYLDAHTAILHDAFLHVLDMDVLLHADVFFYKILQFDVHSEWDGPLEEKGEFFRVQAPQVGIVEYAAESLVVGGQEIILLA